MLIGCGGEETEFTFDAATLAQGETVYVQNCASCHGEYLEGGFANNVPAPSHLDDGHTWHHSDEWLLNVIRNGGNVGNSMPAYKDVLSEEEMVALLDYIKSHWSERTLQSQARLNQ